MFPWGTCLSHRMMTWAQIPRVHVKSGAVAASVIPELLGEKRGGDRRALKLAGWLAWKTQLQAKRSCLSGGWRLDGEHQALRCLLTSTHLACYFCTYSQECVHMHTNITNTEMMMMMCVCVTVFKTHKIERWSQTSLCLWRPFSPVRLHVHVPVFSM